MHVLFVCTGNICRSPMAEQLFRLRAREIGLTDVETFSAGTWATDGSPATDEAQQVLIGAGVDGGGSAHRSQTLTKEMVERADLVIAMTSVHLREISSIAPGSQGKVFLLKEITELGESEPDLRGLRAARRPEWRRALDLDDPMGFGIGTYRSCFREIAKGIDELLRRLAPTPDQPLPERRDRADRPP
jgi:protein-tyrosine phosphatase